MIDTWLLAAFCLFLLMAGALVRVLRAPKREDRLLAGMIAVTTGSAAALTLGISQGTLFVLELTIVLALLCYAGIIAVARFGRGDRT